MSDQFEIRKPEYLESFKPFRDSISLNQIASFVEEQINQKGQNTVRCLDSMAGTGIVGKKMKEIFPEISITYQDASEKMLSSEHLTGEETIFSDAKAINVENNSFDIVFCRGGLNNVSEKEYRNILEEYIRIICNDGIIIIQDHFAQTDEQKEIINKIESEIAKLEGRTDETYVPTIDELRSLIEKIGGKIKNNVFFEVELPLKNRFASKDVLNPDLSGIKGILEKQETLKYEIKEGDIILKYPITTLVFGKITDIAEKTKMEIHEILDENSIEKGFKFLETENQEGFYPSYINNTRKNSSSEQQAHREIFSSIVIADALINSKINDSVLKQLLKYLSEQANEGIVTFFENSNLIVPDADSNALAFSVLLENGYIKTDVANAVLDKILEHTDSEGIVQTWLSGDEPNQIDHVVTVNVLYLANLLNRSDEFKSSEEFILKQLKSEKYLNGSRYYPSPDSFLYFISRLMKFPNVKEKIESELRKQVESRIGATKYPLDLAMRIICTKSLRIDNADERKILSQLQEDDGSWPFDSLYKEGKKPRFYGNKSIPTALATKALQ